MEILVLGGNGFIGTHLVNNLLNKGHKITIFDRSPKKGGKQTKQIQGDILNAEKVENAVKNSDGAINLVGRLGSAETVGSPFKSVDVNIKGALNFYEAVKKYDKPAVQITMGAYSWPNTYSITKYAAEKFALMYNLYQETKIGIVRAMNVYGPGQKHKPVKKVFPNFIIPALKNEPLMIYGDGEQLIDVIYAEDNAEILARALLNDHNAHDTVFEAGTGDSITVNELADLIIELTESDSEKKYVPMREGEPFRSVTKANAKTLKPLKFSPKNLTPLEKGLKRTINWYKKNLNKFK